MAKRLGSGSHLSATSFSMSPGTRFIARLIVSFIAVGLSLAPGMVRADEGDPHGASHTDTPPAPTSRKLAFGLQLDLFPTVASAIDGEFGIAPQVWLGVERVRVRLVAARVALPDGLAFVSDGFTNARTTAAALIFDYTFGEKFDGWWVGTGVEVWAQSIENERVRNLDGTNARADYTSVVFTVGGGYTWRFAGNWFLDPWVGLHATLNPRTVTIGAYEYASFPLQANASIKVGYFFDL